MQRLCVLVMVSNGLLRLLRILGDDLLSHYSCVSNISSTLACSDALSSGLRMLKFPQQ